MTQDLGKTDKWFNIIFNLGWVDRVIQWTWIVDYSLDCYLVQWKLINFSKESIYPLYNSMCNTKPTMCRYALCLHMSEDWRRLGKNGHTPTSHQMPSMFIPSILLLSGKFIKQILFEFEVLLNIHVRIISERE